MPLLPPRPTGKRKGSTVNLFENLWEELDEIAEAENYTRNEVIEHFLQWAVSEYRREKQSQSGTTEGAPEAKAMKRPTRR